MIVLASALRISRPSRRIPSVGSLVRVLGSVRVSDSPYSRPWSELDQHTRTTAGRGHDTQAGASARSA